MSRRGTHGRPAKRRCKRPDSKVRFPDHSAAVASLHQAERARRFAQLGGHLTARRELRVYECHRCGGFHLTSQESWGAVAA